MFPPILTVDPDYKHLSVETNLAVVCRCPNHHGRRLSSTVQYFCIIFVSELMVR